MSPMPFTHTHTHTDTNTAYKIFNVVINVNGIRGRISVVVLIVRYTRVSVCIDTHVSLVIQ